MNVPINFNKPYITPTHNFYLHLVYCAGGEDLNDVIINGKVIMRDREAKTIDEGRVLKEANEFKVKIK